MERLERYKFKGQRVDNGECVYGGYFGCSEEDGFVHYIYTGYDGAVAVKPEIVAQFLFLDKNGDEVYDGDKVNMHVFTQELGEGMGVIEGEKEFNGIIYCEEFGLAFKETDDDEEWFYLVYAPGMIHEESFELIK